MNCKEKSILWGYDVVHEPNSDGVHRVYKGDEAFHVDSNGEPLYTLRHSWVSDFIGEFAECADETQRYIIDKSGFSLDSYDYVLSNNTHIYLVADGDNNCKILCDAGRGFFGTIQEFKKYILRDIFKNIHTEMYEIFKEWNGRNFK